MRHSYAVGVSGHEFDRGAAERIIQRAVRLSEDDPTFSGGISELALVEAAEELGIGAELVARAVTEERLGLLEPDQRPADRVVGPATVVATRIVTGAQDDVMDAADAWLRRSGVLRRRRHEGHVAEYHRRSDPIAGVQRAVRSITGEEDLTRITRLRVSVLPLDTRRCLVGLEADLSDQRTAALAGGSGVAFAGSAASVVGSFSEIWWWLGVPASLGAGFAVMAARRHAVDDARLQIEGALDRIVALDPQASTISTIGRRLRSPRSRSGRVGDR